MNAAVRIMEQSLNGIITHGMSISGKVHPIGPSGDVGKFKTIAKSFAKPFSEDTTFAKSPKVS